MPYYVYILQSDADGSFYIGSTNDLTRRLNEHNSGMSKYTSRKIPWKIVYTEEFSSRSEAMKREVFLKKQRNCDFYLRLVPSQREG